MNFIIGISIICFTALLITSMLCNAYADRLEYRVRRLEERLSEQQVTTITIPEPEEQEKPLKGEIKGIYVDKEGNRHEIGGWHGHTS